MADQDPFAAAFQTQKPNPPPEGPKKSTASGSDPFAAAFGISAPDPEAPAVPQAENPHGNFFTTSVLKYGTGKTATEKYSEIAKGLLPESIKKSKGSDWVARFAVELGKAGPEVLDFATSPAGAALIAAHMFPATAPIAGIVDFGLGAVGMAESFSGVGKALKSGSPEDWADAITEMTFSLGMAKTGVSSMVARTAKYRVSPLEERSALREMVSNAPGDKKVELLESAKASAPPAKGLQKLYDHPIGRNLAAALDIPKPKVLQISADIVADRAAFIAQRNFDINRELYDFKREVPVAERDVQKLGYVIQGDATPDEVGLSKEARSWLPRIREWTKKQDEVLREAYGDSISLLDAEHYLTQVWDPSSLEGARERKWALPEPKSEATTESGSPSMAATGSTLFKSHVARTLMHDPYLKKRTINSYKVGIEELGLKPRFNDVADLLKRRADFATQAIANRRMAGWLRDLGAIVTEKEARDLKLFHWKPATDAPALMRATYAGTTEAGMPYFERRPVYVHPDFDMAANAVFGKGFDFPGFGALDSFRAVGKRLMLTFSMFHHAALSEQGHAIYALRKPFPGIGEKPANVRAGNAINQTFLFNPHFYSGVKTGIWEAFNRTGDRPPIMRMDPLIVREALGDGLNLKSEEREAWLLEKMQGVSSSNNLFGRLVGGPVKGIAKVMGAWDSALWDYYHQGMMMDAFHTILADEMPKLGAKATPEQIKQLRRTTANHVNNAYGALSFEQMLLSPRFRQGLNFLLLAPAWTLSNLRVLTSGFENEAATRITSKYVAGAALSWFMTTQALNYTLTGHYKTEDRNGKKGPHFSWDNPGVPATIAGRHLDGLSENAFNISAGYNPDGTQRYIVLGKGFREPLSWVISPIQMLGNKLSAPLRLAITQITMHSPGSGYQEIDPRASTKEQLMQRAVSVGESSGIPFVLRDPLMKAGHAMFPEDIKAPVASSQLMSFPTRRGMTLSTAVKAYSEAMDSNDWDLAAEVLSQAALNKIDPTKVRRTALADKKRKQKQAKGPAIEYDTFGNVVKK